MSDSWHTLRERSEIRLKFERSDFLGIAFPVETEDAFFHELQRIEKKHFDATHHCWAFRLFSGGNPLQRHSDAGEPTGTAGRPILAAIEGAALHDVGVVVVRWFGGVKLGTGGLSRAYRDTASASLRRAETLERFLLERFVVRVPFAMLGAAYRLADPPHIVLVHKQFGEVNDFTFDVRRSRAAEFARLLTEKRFLFTPP
jgi:uncharacterized YigZ family protein